MSVLLPLQDEREVGIEAVRAWTTGQTAPAESFEIIAIALGEDAGLEQAVRPLLREQDRWLDLPGADEYAAFDHSAKEARGEFLFVTETHCVPERDCLAAMLEELDRTGAVGVRGASVPEMHGPLGELELGAVQDAQREEEDPEHWRKVLIHSLAIRRDLYLDAGGIPTEYGDFAPYVLSMALYERGELLTVSPRPRVRHVYDGDLGKLSPYIRSFMHGEIRFRTESPVELTGPFLEWATEWEQRLQYTRAGALRALRAAVALRHRGTFGALPRHVSVALFGPLAPIAGARRRAALAARRARGARERHSRAQAFRDFWWLTSRRGRLEGLRAAGDGHAQSPVAARSMNLTEPLGGRAIGFYDPESLKGEEPFRWTAPLALLRVGVPDRGPMRARLDLLPVERPRRAPARVRVSIDNRIVPTVVSNEAVEFEIDHGEHWIGIACSPLRPRRYGVDDSRALGVPVRSIDFEPV
jgi:hypothetical protein